ncbi:MAG TPA: MFS transporter [Acidimicrobiales bacterium]|nr:MFS transporter [Acidimicrobiales bacterium]
MTIHGSQIVAAGVPSADRRRWIALVVVCLAMFMNALDGSIVNVALPAIQKSLHFNQSGLTWVVDAYLISFGSFLLMAGRLGDLIGRKKVFLAGVTLFTLSSIVCGAAGSQEMLVAARFVQGIGGALSSSVIVAIIVTEFTSMAERAKAMSAYVFVAVGGGSIGLLAGGVLTQILSWHWIFFVNVPVGIATLIAGYILLVDNVGLGIRQGVDWVGSVLVTASVMVAIYAIVTASTNGWVSAHTLGFLILAVALMVAFLVLESKLPNPIMPLRILKLRTLTGSAVVRGLLVIGMFSTFFIGALYLEHVLHYSPVKTGLAFLPQALGMAGMSTGITAWLVGRFGNKTVMYPGMVLAAVGLLLFASAGPHASYFPRIFFAFLMMGIGAGTAFMPLLQIGMSEIPNADAGLGSGVVNVSQQLAGAIGLAALGTIAENSSKSLLAAGHDVVSALAHGYQLALYIAAGCVTLAIILSPIVLRTEESPQEQDARIKENMQAPEAYEHLVL